MTEAQPKTVMRTVLEGAIGTVIGFILSCVAGPKVISMWYAPPSQDAFSCAGTVNEALSQFVKMQLGVSLAGGVVLVLVLFFGRRALKKRREPTRA